MSNERLFVDIHVLQTLPPSCANRDDTGSPKTAIYGGATRARVSSQSWKRAMREEFKDIFDEKDLSVRTKKAVEMLADVLFKKGITEDNINIAESLLKKAKFGIKEKDKTTEALFFFSFAQANALAELYIKNNEINDEDIKKALEENLGFDIALFGRMVAGKKSLSSDACSQVAHAISTHEATTEYDYFTALDEYSDEETGAGHMGTVEFNSATMYRYATIAVHALNKLLGKDTKKVVEAFVDAFCLSMPTGKQNTFANRTFPDAILVTLRNDQPVNLVGAFEKPVQSSDNGFVKPSCKKLVQYANEIYESFSKPVVTYVLGEDLSELGKKLNMKELSTKTAESAMELLLGGK